MVWLVWNWFADTTYYGDRAEHRKHTSMYEDLCM